jgi:hypothetical protein
MLRHYTLSTHRCSPELCVTVPPSACNSFVAGTNRADAAYDLCATCDGYRADHAAPAIVPEWIRRARANTLPSKDMTRA